MALCLAVIILPSVHGRAQAPAQPDPQAILRAVRMTAALQEGDLRGEISNGEVKFPFGMALNGGRIVFSFTQPDQAITLYLDDDTFRFTEKTGMGEEKPVPPQRHGESLRGTDITYEDLALRFLFWKRATILGETELKTRKAWKMRIDNPGAPGPYSVVYAWIDQESPALLRVQGYNQQGRCVKQFEILSGMKVGDGWMLKEMRVETMDGATDKVTGRTYMRLEKPKDRPKDGNRPDW
jgi:hypothetical protein